MKETENYYDNRVLGFEPGHPLFEKGAVIIFDAENKPVLTLRQNDSTIDLTKLIEAMTEVPELRKIIMAVAREEVIDDVEEVINKYIAGSSSSVECHNLNELWHSIERLASE